MFAGLALPDSAAWQADVLAIWRGGRFPRGALRGDRADRRPRGARLPAYDALAMYEEMIVTGAWWDYVDAIADQRLGRSCGTTARR